MADFINPGDAAGQALQGFLVQQQQQKQQALINSMAQSRLGIEQAREGRLSQLEQLQIQEGRATQARLAQEEVEKEADKVAKNMQPGDIPDAQAAATLKKAGQGFLLHPGPSQTSTIPAADPTMPAPGQGVDPATGAPVTTPAPALPGALPAQTTTIPGALRFQGLPAQREELRKQGARQQIADAIRVGADPKEIAASALETGLPASEISGLLTSLKPKQAAVPEVGTFGDYLSRIAPGGDLTKLTPQIIETARAKWGADSRAPVQQVATQLVSERDTKGMETGRYFAYNPRSKTFDLVQGAVPVAIHAPPSDTADPTKLNPTQEAAFKEILKRKTAEHTRSLTNPFASGLDDATQSQILKESYDEAKGVTTGSGVIPGLSPALAAILQKLQKGAQ